MEVIAYRADPDVQDAGYVECFGITVEPGAPDSHPYQAYQDWVATGHRDAQWAFAVPPPPQPPVSIIVATRLARAVVFMARGAWMLTLMAARSIPASAANRREARHDRPLRPLLVPDYRRKVRQRSAVLAYSILVTVLVCWPYFWSAYEAILALWDSAVQHGAQFLGSLGLTH